MKWQLEDTHKLILVMLVSGLGKIVSTSVQMHHCIASDPLYFFKKNKMQIATHTHTHTRV